MELEKRSSGVAKAGLATGIVGSSLGLINLLGNGANAAFTASAMNNQPTTVVPVMPMANWGWNGCGTPWNTWGPWGNPNGCGCNEDHFVTRYDASKDARIAELESQQALRDANTFTDQKMLEMYKFIDGRFREVETQLARQAVNNQATADSFQTMQERMDCCCRRLEDKICDEARERRCADNTIITYTNATFYPKQVADVTVGTEMTPQRTYNPLPAQRCCCDN